MNLNRVEKYQLASAHSSVRLVRYLSERDGQRAVKSACTALPEIDMYELGAIR